MRISTSGALRRVGFGELGRCPLLELATRAMERPFIADPGSQRGIAIRAALSRHDLVKPARVHPASADDPQPLRSGRYY